MFVREMFVREVGAARALSPSELALVSGGILGLSAMAVVGSFSAMDYDTYCGNGPKPLPHFTAVTAVVLAAGG